MHDRDQMIADFLAGSAWASWQQHPITGDASARRYFRLSDGTDRSAILMDASQETAGTTAKFARICQILTDQGLSPPSVLLHDPTAGLMVISDLGHTDFAGWLRTTPGDQKTLYTAATDVLIALQQAVTPDDLIQLTPDVAAQMVEIVGSHYVGHALPDLTAEIKNAFHEHAPHADTLALRDYHAENLIWRPERKGLDQVGLLDFQDAFVAPAGYDLASLRRDVRRDIPAQLVEDMTDYFCTKTNAKPTFRAQLACLGVQRNLRILGVFARLATDHGKTGYLGFMPRVWANICADLDHPALAQLKQVVQDTVPAPTPDFLAKVTA